MQKNRLRKLWNWLQVLALIYVVCGALLYFLQEKFLFHPKKLDITEAYHFDHPFREINLPVSEEKNLSIVQFIVPDSQCRGVVLYFHGNRKNIARYAGFASAFTRNNYEVWMIDYPGFGKSTGHLTEEAMYGDALILYKMARARFASDSIIIYGKSLGTGVASQLATIRDCQRLILETPYYNIETLASHYAFIYPTRLMTKYHFPNNEFLPLVRVPVSIFHGTNDEVIPFKHARKLSGVKDGCELISIENGRHNNLATFPVYDQKLDSLLRR